MNSAPHDQKFRVAVLGAGITGLAAAHRLATRAQQSSGMSLDVTVFDSADRTGGIIQTIERDGFLIELGPDSFITNKPGAIDLCRDIQFSDQLIPTDETWRRSLVLRDGRPMPVPEGFMLMAPSSPWAILTTPILSISGRLRLLSEAFVSARQSDDDESLASFVRRRFGRETLDRLVQPLVGGIYTSDPEKLSLQATLPRFPQMERQYGSVIRGTLSQKRRESGAKQKSSGSGARYGLFLTARNGLSQMVDATTAACMATGVVHLQLRSRIESLVRHGPGDTQYPTWSVQVQTESMPRQFDAVIITLPTHRAADILPTDDCQSLCNALRSIDYASSAIVVSGHRLSDFKHPLDAFGLVIPDQEHRKILAVSFSSRKFPGRAPDGCVLLRTFVGGAMQPHLLQQSDPEIVKLVDDELTSMLGMQKPPMFSQVVRYTNAMPQYHVGHLQRVQEIFQACALQPGLQLAGSAYHGVGIPDSIASGRDAADRTYCQLENQLQLKTSEQPGER